MNGDRDPHGWAGGALVFAAALLAAGCASNVEPARTSLPERVDSMKFKASAIDGVEFDADWWSAFDDPHLARLISRALSTNIDIRVALERVEQARAGSTAVASRSTPTISATGSASRSASGLPDDVKRGLPDTRAVRGALDLNWEIDIFGGARAAYEASTWDGRAAEAGAQAARLLVASEVARQYFIWQGARSRLSRLEQLLALQSDLERLVRSRHAGGQASDFDVSRAAGETRTLAAQLPSLRTLAAVAENQLAVLLALAPSEAASLLPNAEQPHLVDAPTVGTGQPVELLKRRPDLVAAEYQMAAEAARLKESQADLLPKFFIAALFGGQDLELNGRDLSPVRYSNLALAFSLPVFNRGRLQAMADRQAARQRSAVLQYEKTVLSALEDVENSLVRLQQERLRLVELREAELLRQTGLRHARSLYREGQIDQLQLLDAQRALVAAELSTADSRMQQLLAAVQLYKAMGGGWRPAPPAVSATQARTPDVAATSTFSERP